MGDAGVFLATLSMGVFGVILYFGSMLYSYFFSKAGRNIRSRDYYECGFKAVPDSRLPMDINFSAVGLIFLLYEMEVLLFVPLALNWFGMPLCFVILILISIFILGLSY